MLFGPLLKGYFHNTVTEIFTCHLLSAHRNAVYSSLSSHLSYECIIDAEGGICQFFFHPDPGKAKPAFLRQAQAGFAVRGIRAVQRVRTACLEGTNPHGRRREQSFGVIG